MATDQHATKTWDEVCEGVSLTTETLTDGSKVYGVSIHGICYIGCLSELHALALADHLSKAAFIFGPEGFSP